MVEGAKKRVVCYDGRMRKLVSYVAILLFVVLAAGSLAGCRKKEEPQQPTAQQPVRPPVNVIEVTQRPYVSLSPTQNGRNLELVLHDVKQSAQAAEYEIEYQTGDMLQGAYGELNLDELPYSEDILLGSCSAGGKCTYHENVTGGELLLTFEGDEEYALKNGWSFIDNQDGETAFSSQDSKFRLQGDALAAVNYLVIYNTPGLPENVEQALVSAPYSVAADRPLKEEVTVTIRMDKETTEPTILGWDGEAWVELTTSQEEKMASAQGPLYEAYVVVE